MKDSDTSTNSGANESPDQPLFDLVPDPSVQIARHVAASRRSLTDAQRRALVYKIGRRRVATAWVR